MSVPIRVYSDFVCPFCYLGEFPLAEALAGRDVVVEWMPFELRPEPHPTLRPEGDYLQRAWAHSVYPMARRMGVRIHLPLVSPQPHTHLAWEGFQFARERGRGTEYNHRVLTGFFVTGLDIGRADVLAGLAAEVGLDETLFREALTSRRYREAHRQALRHAERAAVTGVPAFEIGNRILVGVQPREALEAAIEAASPGEAGLGAVSGPDGGGPAAG
ncbi:MAG: oxidoreductase [Gemmataceae bacterium]|nr:oxidoreductase [Gemmataceae bacterium]